jgi:hypothetical protein
LLVLASSDSASLLVTTESLVVVFDKAIVDGAFDLAEA